MYIRFLFARLLRNHAVTACSVVPHCLANRLRVAASGDRSSSNTPSKISFARSLIPVWRRFISSNPLATFPRVVALVALDVDVTVVRSDPASERATVPRRIVYQPYPYPYPYPYHEATRRHSRIPPLYPSRSRRSSVVDTHREGRRGSV